MYSALVACRYLARNARSGLDEALGVVATASDVFGTVEGIEVSGLLMALVSDLDTPARASESTKKVLQACWTKRNSLMQRFRSEGQR